MASTLNELHDKADYTYIKALENQVSNMLVRVEAPPKDLSPTTSVNNLLALLRDMLSTASMNEGREVDMIKVTGILSKYFVYKIFIVFLNCNKELIFLLFSSKYIFGIVFVPEILLNTL